jgi:hypothetical protein
MPHRKAADGQNNYDSNDPRPERSGVGRICGENVLHEFHCFHNEKRTPSLSILIFTYFAFAPSIIARMPNSS